MLPYSPGARGRLGFVGWREYLFVPETDCILCSVDAYVIVCLHDCLLPVYSLELVCAYLLAYLIAYLVT